MRFALATRPFARVAAGSSWTLVIANAPWAARRGHTSVINATGAIYVIGGFGSDTYYNDVWVSTDGGSDRTREGGNRGGTFGYRRGFFRGYLWGTQWYSRGIEGVLPGYLGTT